MNTLQETATAGTRGSRFGLESLGLHGLGGVRDALLAGLALGDPILLVGSPGCAKTLLARRIAAALHLRFQAYDASKALFEDMIGFPSPRALAEGRLEYVPSALSLWDKEFILVDEVSRASAASANKWLEVIRSRQVMGLPLTRLRQVVGAMNLPGDVGTSPLDMALADRFAFHIQMPETRELPAEILRVIVEERCEDDSPALPTNGKLQRHPSLGTCLDAIRSRYREVEETFGDAASEYVVSLAATLLNARVALSARRCGMLRRNILAVLAVRDRRVAVLGEAAGDVLFAVQSSLPHAATGEDLCQGVLVAAHGKAVSSRRSPLPTLRIDDPVLLGRGYARDAARLEPHEHHEVVTALEHAFREAETASATARAYVGVHAVLHAMQGGDTGAPSDAVLRCAKLHEEMVGPLPRDDHEVHWIPRGADHARSGDTPVENVSLRLAIHRAVASERGSGESARLWEEHEGIRKELTAVWGEEER